MNPRAQRIVQLCTDLNITFAFAESCTGGALAYEITKVPGASKVFLGSIVAYCDNAKMQALGVDGYTLGRKTAVSSEVAEQMVEGAQDAFAEGMRPHLVVSTTGYLGPYEGTTVPQVAYIGLQADLGGANVPQHVHDLSFKTGDREGNREAVIDRAFVEMLRILEHKQKQAEADG